MDFFGILFDMKNGSKVPYSKSYFDTLFAAKLAEMQIKTLTGVLPLTFTAKGGTAADWVIYGNDNVGENLFDIPDNTSIGYNNYYASAVLSADVISTISSYLSQHIDEELSWYVDIDTTYTGSYYFSIVLFYSDGTYQSFQTTRHFTPSKTVVKIEMRVVYNNAEGIGLQYTFKNITIVKGSTAPDHYIPYQQGVGERTDNLFNPNEQIIINGVPYIGSTYPAGKYRIYNVSNFPCYYKIGESGATGTVNLTNNVYLNAGDTVYIWCSISSNRKICVSEGLTAIPYEPYGYQIPLTISKQGQPDKSYNIYIGDSPLTEGETVSKTSAGVDIELFEGENTVSTTLYNKPTIEIKYK